MRGFRKHKPAHVLSMPGMTDITADVDFDACRKVIDFKYTMLCHINKSYDISTSRLL